MNVSPPAPSPLLVRVQIRLLRESGASFGVIAAMLNRHGVRGFNGGRWFASSVRRALLGPRTPATS
jgi:hypothetical protein